MPRTSLKHTLPMITMKGLVVFPGMVLNFDVTRPRFVEAVKTACLTDKHIFIITQNDFEVDEPRRGDLFRIASGLSAFLCQ